VTAIRPLAGDEDVAICAAMMANSDPWLRLGRGYEASVRLLTDPTREVYVAGGVSGFVIINMHGAFAGYIQTICVAPELRGRGLGSELMAFAEARILRDSPNVFLCVSSFNPRARALYERLGYARVGELHDYIVRGAGEILMRKTIAPLNEFTAQPAKERP
jgi:ribosomal-protein-alanine N-acetyltransferase